MSEETVQPGPLLSAVSSPEDLRRLRVEKLPALAAEIRDFMVQSVSRTGGHLASSLGSVELAIALHYVFNTPDDKVVWDVGHQAYAHKILTGRREAMANLRQYGGISGFPRRGESEYDAFGTAHSSTSISAALGMAVADHLAGNDDRWHIAVIGDGALTGGMAVEALNHAGVYKEGVRLLIILNDNNCSISPAVGALSGHLGRLVSTKPVWTFRSWSKALLRHLPGAWNMAKRFEKQTVNFLSPQSSIFSTFDLNYFGPVDGHNLPRLVGLLKNLRAINSPIVLHVKTVKGKGYAPAEADPTTYHGVSRFDPAVGIEPKAPDPRHPTYTQVFSGWVCDMARADKTLYAITPAMREGSGLVAFEKEFPDRYRDVAIAEQHAVTYAAGLACAGMHPVVALYSTFAQRAYDQIVHDVAIQNLPVTFAIDRGGIVGADGCTHHGVFDLAFLRSLPNLTVMAPSNEDECRKMLSTAFSMPSPAAVRYPRGKGPGIVPEKTLETIPVGRARILRESGRQTGKGRVAFLAFGSMVERLRNLAEEFDATLVDMRFVKPLDEEIIARMAETHELLVTAEEGVLAGGAGSAVLEVLSCRNLPVSTLVIGIPDRFVPQGDMEHLLADLQMDEVGVRGRVAQRLSQLVKSE